MALLDRCIWNATAIGTGDFVESTAVAGFRTMENSNVIDGENYSYVAQSSDLSQWEYGRGIWTTSTKTLSRTTILGNSLGTYAAINFATIPQILITVLAEDFADVPIIGNRTWYVATTGNDNNPGTAAAPFLTIQHALNVAGQYNYMGLFYPTINVADGTYHQATWLAMPALEGISANFTGHLTGNTTTPANCIVTDSPNGGFLGTGGDSRWAIGGFQIISAGPIFGVYNGALMRIDGNMNIGGGGFGSFFFLYCQEYASFFLSSITVNFLSTNLRAFIQAYNHCNVQITNSTFVFQPGSSAPAGYISIDFFVSLVYRSIGHTNPPSPAAVPTIDGSMFCSIMTDNGLSTDIPGVTTGDFSEVVLDGTCNFISYVSQTNALWFRNGQAGIPTSSDIANNCWGFFKDTSGGSVGIYFNDGGTIKSVLLST